MNLREKALKIHKENKGKLEVKSKVELTSKEELGLLYSPGVAEPSKEIAKNDDDVYKYTAKGNSIAIVTDGTAVLGLGDIGPKAALPVMEGKAILFKELGNVDAYPICLDTTDTEEIIRTIKILAPGFGGVNLEDISAPRCFEIEARLKEELDIPVFHDDQHGTAIAVLAGLINAHKVLNKSMKDSKVVINGAGAAGIAIGKILLEYGIKDLIMVDRNGIINKEDSNSILNDAHKKIAEISNKEKISGPLSEALIRADVFVGVSRPDLVSSEMVKTMNNDPIIFAMANPKPEIMPENAYKGGAAIVGTGRADYPNMINNIMVFPGIMKGALEVRASDINEEMKLAAAEALAAFLEEEKLTKTNIFPDPLDKRLADYIAKRVSQAARKSKVARI